MNWLSRILTASLALVLVASACFAGDDCDDWRKRSLGPQRGISACTEAINSGQWTGKNQAINYNNRGNAWQEIGQEDNAISDYNRAIELDPTYATPFNGRGNIWRKRGQVDMAIADFSRSIELDPGYVNPYNGRGNSWMDKGDYQRAMDDYNMAIRLQPGFALTYYNRSIAQEKMGNMNGALQDIRQYIQLNPNDPDGPQRLQKLQTPR